MRDRRVPLLLALRRCSSTRRRRAWHRRLHTTRRPSLSDSAVVDVDQVEEILFFEIASSSKSRSAAILLPFLWLVVDVVGGGVQSFFLRVMVGTGYPHPAQCEFAYPPRLHRLHNYTVLCRMDCCLSILHQWSQKKNSSGWRIGGCSLLDTTSKGRPVCRFHDV